MRIRLASLAAMFTLLGACATASTEPDDGTGASAQSCKAECNCTTCGDTEARLCDENVDDLTQRAAAKGCVPKLTEYFRCISEDATCFEGNFDTSICNAESTGLYSCLAGTPTGCTHLNDGTCDEPEGTGLCAEGTDVIDCAVGTCPSTNDGTCDEPEGTDLCAEGTDVNDCVVGTCPYTNDGKCDEPEGTALCAEGTDVNDCAVGTCAYTNNGTCDEPEGTALCAEGTDVNDCAVGTCPYTNDGECDEPEGTGLCPEGSDPADCAA